MWKTYVQSVFELDEASVNGLGENGNDVETVDNTTEKCHEFICTILEGVADNSKRYVLFLLAGSFMYIVPIVHNGCMGQGLHF